MCGNNRMTNQCKESEDKKHGGKKNRDSYDDADCFIFPVFSVKIIFLDDSEFCYTSSPIPDFIMT